MKKNKQAFLIILIVSIAAAIALPLVFKDKNANTLVEDILYLLLRTFLFFVFISLAYFAQKSRMTNILKVETIDVADGYHEFYNENNKPLLKGLFEAGNLYNGTKYIYNKDGSLFQIEIYKNGIRCDVKKEN
jgi:hypothetical protein